VTDPRSNQTLIDFSQDSATLSPSQNFYETQRTVYQGTVTGSPLLLQQSCYNAHLTACDTAAVSTPITQIDTFRSIANGTNPNRISASEAIFDSTGYGLRTDVKEYDYGVTLGSAPQQRLWFRETLQLSSA
jgi:hypothetical protein